MTKVLPNLICNNFYSKHFFIRLNFQTISGRPKLLGDTTGVHLLKFRIGTSAHNINRCSTFGENRSTGTCSLVKACLPNLEIPRNRATFRKFLFDKSSSKLDLQQLLFETFFHATQFPDNQRPTWAPWPHYRHPIKK